jgi:hypothetical protein
MCDINQATKYFDSLSFDEQLTFLRNLSERLKPVPNFVETNNNSITNEQVEEEMRKIMAASNGGRRHKRKTRKGRKASRRKMTKRRG